MFRKLLMVLPFLVALCGTSMAQLRVPNVSPYAAVKQSIGLSTIEINYFRPSARGRKVFGEEGIVPFGEAWRAGANSATKIILSDDFNVRNEVLAKGEYALLAIPLSDRWELQFYPYDSQNWLSYVPKSPVFTVLADVNETDGFKETFSISLENVMLNTANLVLHWGNLQATLPMEVEIDTRVMSQIERVMKGPSNNDYFQAALFMHERGIDLEKALEYIQKVTSNKDALFFQVHREALILSDLGRAEEAIVAAQRSMKLSDEAGNQDFVRLNQRLIEKLKN